DYVIQSFSRDKPFNQFLVEQLAGDELFDYENPKNKINEKIYESLVATGFLRTTPDRTFQDITNFVPDRLDVIADEIQVLGSAILGMTVNCSRCHAHKFDPIPQQDYYRLSAIFKGAYDEHDWLKPENRNLEIPTSRLASDVPSYVLESAKEGKISIRALWSRGRPSPAYLLLRGNPLTPGEKIEPNLPEFALASIKRPVFQIEKIQHQTQKSGRRLAFANWITSESHPLTSRVFVNRVWHSLFGKGIVETLDNFGKTGAKPSHPELLDYLAVQFIDDAWSVKQLIRRMVTSRTYQQSSQVEQKTLKIDPDNSLYSRMPLKRLSAETVRDAILKITRQLSSHKFGPPRPVEEQGNGLILSKRLSTGGWTRSIYVLHRRSKIPTILESFDYPQMGPNCIVRKTSIVPQQALHLTNNAQVHTWCQSLAKSLQEELSNDFGRMISELCLTTFGKPPTLDEVNEYQDYFNQLNQQWSQELSLSPTDPKVQRKSIATICHTLINTAQFLYTD
ncbi:MAG: DUF1553 domain-containing protein, partial [Planctomycetota bacterium]|nr:DUF1553 domain-containing protein [Planctomycetota bacterium]